MDFERLPYGRIKAGGYIFTRHFIERWRERNKNSPSDEKVVEDALKRLNHSYLLKLKPNGEEFRENHGLIFVLKGNLVITLMYTRTKQRIDNYFDKYIEQSEQVI